MQGVLKEADLSAGAVYRYFSGKDELITAIFTEVLGEVRMSFEAAAEQAHLTVDGEPVLPRLIIQVWAESLRNKDLAAVMLEGFGAIRLAWGRIVEAYQDAGMMPRDVPADHVARSMIAAVQGFIAQQTVFGPAPVEVLQSGLRALMGARDPQPEA